LIGRHPACDLCVDDPRISGEHASVRWEGNTWELRDLGSRNGTFVGGQRLAPGERIALDAGATFSLGGAPQSFTVIDVAPPVVSARHTHSGVVRASAGGLLVLPQDDQPLVSVFEDARGRWVAETADATWPVSDREVVIAGGEGWILDLPVASATWEAGQTVSTLETIALRLAVSRDEARRREGHGAALPDLPLPPVDARPRRARRPGQGALSRRAGVARS